MLTDESGFASTYMTILAAGTISLIAQLAPASYPNPKQVAATLVGTSSQLDLSLLAPSVWIAQGATVTLPISARLLSNGAPLSGQTLNYQITRGTANLSAFTAQTDANGNAAVTLQSSTLSSSVQVSVCVAPNNTPCQIFNATAVPLSSLQLRPVSGILQITKAGQSFQPLVIRVVDSAAPPHPVVGASVVFLSYVGRMPMNQPIIWAGETGISQPAMPVILAKSQTVVPSDSTGLASIPVSTAGISGSVAVVGSATAGTDSVQYAAQQLTP